MQSAINALTSGGDIFLKAGTYAIATTISINVANVHVRGTGSATVLQMANAANLALILRVTAHNVAISSLVVDSNQANQTSGAGYSIGIVDRNDCTIQNVKSINGRQGGLLLQGAKRCRVIGCLIQDVGSASVEGRGIYIYSDSSQGCEDNIILGCVINTISKWGIQLQGYDSTHLTRGNTISDTIIVNCGVAALSGGGMNFYKATADNKVDGCIIYNCTGFGIEIYSAGETPYPTRNMVFNTTVIDQKAGGGTTGTGFQIDTNSYDNLISGCVAYNSALDGFAIVTGSYRNRILNCSAISNARNQILIYNNSDNNTVIGCYTFGTTGVNIGTGCDNTLIMLNDLRGSNTGIDDSGTNTVKKHNQGYPTKNGGTVTFSGTGSQTAFVIAHGLASTPNLAVVTAGSSDAKGDFYATYDATNITITYATAPPLGTNNVILRWYAEV